VRFNNPEFVQKVEFDKKQCLKGKTGDITVKPLFKTVSSCCGMKNQQVLKDFHKSPSIDLFQNTLKEQFIEVG